MLRGLGDELQAAAPRSGLRVRTYCPVGDLVAGMAYLVRRLLENTSNESFLAAAGRGRAARGAAGGAVSRRDFANEPVLELRRAPARDVADRRAGAARRAAPAARCRCWIGGERARAARASPRPTRARPSRVVAEAARAPARRRSPRRWQAASAARASGARARPPSAPRRSSRPRRGLRERRLELAALEVRECAKPWAEADADVCEAIDFLEYYARGALELERGRRAAPGARRAQRDALRAARRGRP